MQARESIVRDVLLRWGESELRDFPWRDRSRSLYEVFVAEFFLTQTPAENVADVYPTFLKKYPRLSTIVEASQEELEATIEPLGFQQMRSEALIEIANDHAELPRSTEELQKLPRVGPYVANATLCFALCEPRPIVDRNVIRVYQRVFGDDFPSSKRDRREFARRMLPEDGREARLYNLALLDFGALLCTKRDPQCEACPLSRHCAYVS